ncbi:MAG: hypothetical protein R3F07_03275 [Opitutaceae bacterium]
MAKALLATSEAQNLLPPVALITGSPVIVPTGTTGNVLGPGYHDANGGTLVSSGELPPDVPLERAVQSLRELVQDFDFQSDGDRARAMASLITPALKIGGWLQSSVPVDVSEADASQSGKTYRQKVVAAVYGELPYIIGQRNGGVGSVDESISTALVSGKTFLLLDNLRGRMNTQFLEAVVTADGPVAARVPHRGEVMVDSRGVLFQVTSNGFETTRDLANRSTIIRIRKPKGRRFKEYAEGDLLSHVKGNQAYYLGCVFAVVKAWAGHGRPKTSEVRHDFRGWAQNLDWICQNLLKCGPLMDGHEQAQGRVSNPGLSWLRIVATALTESVDPAKELTATDLFQLCEERDIQIPGLQSFDEAQGRKVIGKIMSRFFKDGEVFVAEGIHVTRVTKEEYRQEFRKSINVNYYSFAACAICD